jgi:threonine/homoserine/homoserine lactone efflux protein
MELSFLLKGTILGFSIAAPVGPIGILCIRKTLQYGRWSGLFSGLGAAVADTIYGIIAAFGLSLISDLLLTGQFWLRLIGGAFLIYLGGKTFLIKPTEKLNEVPHRNLLGDFISTFLLTMTNPMTILSYVAIFASLGLSGIEKSHANAAWLVFGVFIGSSLWWLILSEGVCSFRKRVSQKVMLWINRTAGLIIISFGLAAWISLFFD